MNNYVLQKLIHLYQKPNMIGSVLRPDHFHGWDEKKDKLFYMENKIATLHMAKISWMIQQSAKFNIDISGDQLTDEEMKNCLSDLPMYLPYKSTYLQMELDEGTTCILAAETDYWNKFEDHGFSKHGMDFTPTINATMFHYIKELDSFQYDFITYRYHHYENFGVSKQGHHYTPEHYIFDINGLGTQFVDDSSDESGQYANRDLHQWAAILEGSIVQLLVMLSYPEITIAKDVTGRANSTIGHQVLKRQTKSILRDKPKYEHKTLKLDMYGTQGEGTSTGKRSKGTAFHSVRKHLRRYKNGKRVFVKAHFRGSKEVGVVTKDYEVSK